MPRITAKTASNTPLAVGSPATPRSTTKKDRLIALLRHKRGQDIGQLTTALGWLPHTVRAALSGLRKTGVQVERFPGPDGRNRYRIGTGVAR